MAKIEQCENSIHIPEDTIVTLTKTGETTELGYSSFKSRGSPTTRVSKNQYIINYTGELCEYKHTSNRSQNYKSFNRSLAHARRMINLNVTNLSQCRWVTLTYHENMMDSGRLTKNINKFHEKCRNKYGQYKYIEAVEAQERGAWHFHIIMIFDQKATAPFIPIDVLKKKWKHGDVTIKSINNPYDLSLYLTTCVGDVPLDEYTGPVDKKKIKTVTVDGQLKQYVKGARIHLYPAGFNNFRYSTGLKRPVKEYMTYGEAKKRLKDSTPVYSLSLKITDDEHNFTGYVKHDTYISKKGYKCYAAYEREQDYKYKQIQDSDYDDQSEP